MYLPQMYLRRDIPKYSINCISLNQNCDVKIIFITRSCVMSIFRYGPKSSFVFPIIFIILRLSSKANNISASIA